MNQTITLIGSENQIFGSSFNRIWADNSQHEASLSDESKLLALSVLATDKSFNLTIERQTIDIIMAKLFGLLASFTILINILSCGYKGWCAKMEEHINFPKMILTVSPSLMMLIILNISFALEVIRPKGQSKKYEKHSKA